MSAEIYETPDLTADDQAVLGHIDDLLQSIRPYIRTPRRWFGMLRRGLHSSSVQGSNAIEGYVTSDDNVAAILDGEDPSPDVPAQTWQAVRGYGLAMDFVLRIVDTDIKPDGTSEPVRTRIPLLNLPRLQSLHFLLLQHDLPSRPGLWRLRGVFVRNQRGEVLYTAPDVELVEPLLEVLCEQVAKSAAPKLVIAAMAHLNLVMIHPFADGNGRMARIVQSLILAASSNPGEPEATRGGIQITPGFGNIEQYLWQHQADYYSVLGEMSDGSWSPDRSARPWLEFCLKAHYQQAQTVLRQVAEFELLWTLCERLIEAHGLPERSLDCLCDSARGWRLTRLLYKERTVQDPPLNDGMASRDLAALTRAGLLRPVGEKRGRFYLPSERLAATWEEARLEVQSQSEETRDPYEIVRGN